MEESLIRALQTAQDNARHFVNGYSATDSTRHAKAVVPNFFDLTTLSQKNLKKRLSPAITYNPKDVNNKVETIVTSCVAFLVLTFSCETSSTYGNQWDDWACICPTHLEIILGSWFVKVKLMPSSTSTLFLDFVWIRTMLDNPASQRWVKMNGSRQRMVNIVMFGYDCCIAHLNVCVRRNFSRGESSPFCLSQ